MMCNNMLFGNPIPRECCQQNFMPIPQKPYHPGAPWICGEGEIVPVHYPDGSVQFYFLPKTSYIQYNPYNNCNQPGVPNNIAAWLISSIGQQVNYQNLQPPQVPMNTQQNVLTTVPPYQLKFHGDSCTSTTDLHYFVPRSNTLCIRRAETAVQATQQNRISYLTPNNKIIDINISTKMAENKAKSDVSSCTCAETPQKPKRECIPSSSCPAVSSSDDSGSGDDDSDEECCRENNSKTSPKTKKPKAKNKQKKKKTPKNKSVKFHDDSDCCSSSDASMTEDDCDCDKEGTKKNGRSEYYSFSRKTY